jgi:hypothetical protein
MSGVRYVDSGTPKTRVLFIFDTPVRVFRGSRVQKVLFADLFEVSLCRIQLNGVQSTVFVKQLGRFFAN